MLSITAYPLSSMQSLEKKSEDIFIYQITPEISPLIRTSFAERTTDIHMEHHNLNDGYLILTTESIANAVKSSDFISWKESLGYTIRFVNISDSIIQNQQGNDLPEQIRNFLREYYSLWNIQFLLIIGDINTVPMRYCYPNPDNHEFDIFDFTSGEVPTDYYYADLSSSDEESWDLDGDGYYGEYTQDQPDFIADIFVGRIPINDISNIQYTLNKIVEFEEDSGSWKHHALHAGAFFYFSRELQGDDDGMDGAVLSYYIENDLMDGWVISHYSEQQGLETSVYDWPSLNENSFISDWRNNKYSIVNWQGHGWTDKVARKVWTRDDGDNIPEGSEISWPNFITRSSHLDDDYPSIVTAESCYVGCPEDNPYAQGNLGIDLLTDPSFGAAVAVVASARSPYGSEDWPETPGGSDHIIYEFNKNVIVNKECIAEALYHSKYYCTTNYGWDNYAEYIDLFTFNLFGDPSMKLSRSSDNNPPDKPSISGPSTGKIGVEQTYEVIATDPDGDNIYYHVDWGEDNQSTEVFGPFESGEATNVTHIWNDRGRYTIRVQAIDEFDLKGEWSEPIIISLPKAKIDWLNLFYIWFNFVIHLFG
jgi:hypothetical protein